MAADDIFVMYPTEMGAVGEFDDATGVDDVIGRVQNVAGGEVGAVTAFGQLVIGRSGDNTGPDIADSLIVYGATQGAGRKDIDIDGMDIVRVHGTGA